MDGRPSRFNLVLYVCYQNIQVIQIIANFEYEILLHAYRPLFVTHMVPLFHVIS